MKKKNLLIGFLIIILLAISTLALNITLNSPNAFAVQTGTTVTFNWTPIMDADAADSNNNLFIEGLGNGTFFENVSQDCTNNTVCNVSVINFAVGFYQWFIIYADNSTNATITSSNTETFDTITAETAASLTGGTTEVFNFTTNYTLTITYTVNGVEENCNIDFDKDGAVNITVVTTNVSTACNLTASNSSSFLKLTTTGVGSSEFINVSGNATGANFLNLSNTRVNGTQVSNNTLVFNYTINGVEESCNVTLDIGDSLTVTQVNDNITAVCNVSASNSSGASLLTTKGHGEDEFINFLSGSGLTQIGFSTTIQRGTQDNSTSSTQWFQIRGSGDGNLTINLVNNTRVLGTLFLDNPPAPCSAGNYMTQFSGNSSTCTGSGLTIELNVSASCNITFTGGLMTAFEGCA